MIDSTLFCKVLKFAAHAAAKKDVRYYLKGVRFEVVGDTLTLFGTDGARVAVCSLRLDPTMPTDSDVTVGNDDVKRILSAFGKDKGQVSLQVEKSDKPNDPPTLVVEAGGVCLRAKGLDGVYPDIRRVVPPAGREQGCMPNLSAELLVDACSAINPLAASIKGVRPLKFDASGKPGDVVAIRPSAIDDLRITDLMVVIAPTRY